MGADVGPGPRDDLREAYIATVLDLVLPADRRVTVTPRPAGVHEGRFPDGIHHVQVITASNPRSRSLLAAENNARNDLLRRELHGLSDAPDVRPATGRAANGGWVEDSFAVIDGDRDTLLDLATRHGQLAIYEWTATHLSVVWTAPERADDTLGWAITSDRRG